MDIEKILYMYEDDYNPSSMVPGPRNMADGGQIIGKAGGVVEPGVIYYGVNKRIDKDGKPHVMGKPWEISKTLGDREKTFKAYFKTKAEAQAEYDRLLKKYPDKRFRTKEEQKIFDKTKKAELVESNIYKTRAGNYEVRYKGKTIGTFNDIKDARNKLKTATADDPPTLRTQKLFDGKISFNSVVENTMDDLLEEGYESYSTADINKKLSKKIKKDYNVTNPKILNSIKQVRDLNLDKFKNFKFKSGTGLNQVKPLTKAKQLMLETSFPEIEFDFTTGRKYGIDKASDPIRYKKIKDFISMPSEGSFPYGYQAKDGLWNSLYRSTVSGNRWELISKVPKNWKKDGAWKKAKFKDTQTGDIITYDNLKEYVDSQGGKGAYENSLKSWDNKRELSKIKIMYQGKEQSLGGVLNKVALAKSKKKPPKGMKNLPGFATFHIAHKQGVGTNFWDVEVAYRDANLKLQQLNKSMLAELKNVNNPNQKNKIIKNYAKQIKALPGGASFMFEGQELGKAPTIKSATEAAFKDLGLSKTYKANQKQIQNAMLEFAGTITDKCKIGNAEGGRIGFKTGSADCLRIAKEGLEKGLKTGFKKGNQQILAEGILKSGRFLKDAISLRGLFGPAALAFTAAAEAGIVGYDMLSTGKSFREAVGDSVFNYMLGPKLKIDSVEERNKRMIEEGMTPEQMGKIGAMESAFDDLGMYGLQFNKLAAIDRNRKAIDMSPEDTFNKNAFQLDLDRQEDEARENIQDFNRRIIPERGGERLEGIDYRGGFKDLAEGLARNEFAQLQSVDNPLQSRRGDEKRAARMNELMLQYPDLAPGYDFMEGGIASLNVNKK